MEVSGLANLTLEKSPLYSLNGRMGGFRGGLIAEEKREISDPVGKLTSIPVIKPMN